jgi:two-component system, LuxR family, sensor kinase FixL
MQAFEEFCATTSDLFGVQCQFTCGQPVFIESATTATHLYRIAQEAVGNAVKHGKATAIDISLDETETGVCLSISDNGCGIPEKLAGRGGMGLRTMDVRSKLVSGQFSLCRSESGGVKVVCLT